MDALHDATRRRGSICCATAWGVSTGRTSGPLTAPFTSRYFADLVDATKDRDLHFGQAFVTNLYPHFAVERSTVDAANSFLASRKDLPQHLRRGLVERVAETERAILVRATTA